MVATDKIIHELVSFYTQQYWPILDVMSNVGFCIICTLHFLHFCTLLSKVVIPLNVLTKMFSDGRQVMTIQDISASFQTILLLQCESTSDLTDVVKPGQV